MKLKRRCVALALVLLLSLSVPALSEVRIPADTVEIGAAAFLNIPIRQLTLPSGLQVIGPRAFQNTGLKRVEIPGTVRAIGENAFDTGAALEVVAEANSFAQEWCDEHQIHYVLAGYGDDMPAIFRVGYKEDEEGNTCGGTCVTSLSTDAISLCDTSGQELARWTESSESGTERNWTFECDLPGGTYLLVPWNGAVHGEREWFWADSSGEPEGPISSFYCNEDTYTWLYDEGKDIEYPFIAGQEIPFSVYTADHLEALRVLDENGEMLYEASGLGLTAYQGHSFSCVFTTAGRHTVYAEGSADGVTYSRCSESRECPVIEGAAALYARADTSGTVGQPIAIRAVTTANAGALGLFAGETLLETWDSFEEDTPFAECREETGRVTHTFTEPGDYSLTLKASVDGNNWSDEGVFMRVHISDAPLVYAYSPRSAFVSMVDKMMTVVTSADAETLVLRFSDDNEMTWHASESNPEEIDGKLSWTIGLGIAGAGFYEGEFAAGNEAMGFGAPLPCSFAVYDLPSVSRCYAYTEGDFAARIDLRISPFANYVGLFAADGSMLAEYTAEECEPYYDSWAQTEDWEITYSWDAPGTQIVSVRASADGTNWGPEKWIMVQLPDPEGEEPNVCYNGYLRGGGNEIYAEVILEGEGTSALSAVRLTDLAGEELVRWSGEEVELVIESEYFPYPQCHLSWEVDEPGDYWVILSVSEDGETFEPLCVELVSIAPYELRNYRKLESLVKTVGPMKFEKTTMCEYWGDEFHERYVSALTPASDPGWLYVEAWDDYIEEWKLCGPSEWTFEGLSIGMTVDEVMTAALARGLNLDNNTVWDRNAERITFVSTRDMMFIHVFFEEGRVTELRTAPMAGG